MNGPLVTIVTPCWNAAKFIERTIESVLAQRYPHLEYLVMDAGSTDGTLDIIERYRGRLHCVSEPDRGAADAINRGFERARGSIVAWLSADDTYFPDAVETAIEAFHRSPQAAVVYGGGVWTDEGNSVLGRYPTVNPFDPAALERECCICQPAAFIRRECWEKVGGLNPALQLAFDYDLWIRLSRKYPFTAISQCLAASRMHPANKSLGQKRRMYEENIQVLRRELGYVPVNWVYGYLAYLRDGRDQYFEPLRHSGATYLAALVAGSWYNYRSLRRYWREWTSKIHPMALMQSRRS